MTVLHACTASPSDLLEVVDECAAISHIPTNDCHSSLSHDGLIKKVPRIPFCCLASPFKSSAYEQKISSGLRLVFTVILS